MDSDISIVFWFVSGTMWIITIQLMIWKFTNRLTVRIGKRFVTGG